MKKSIHWLLNPPLNGPATIFIIRLMVGSVFFFEGILKLVYTNQGVGRFTKLGFPMPDITAHFVAVAEIVGGALIVAGLCTRLVAVYFVLQMLVAFFSTKISLYLGTSPLAPPPSPPKSGIWALEHESRVDFAQLLSSLFLAIEGPGKFSIDFMRSTFRVLRRRMA
jgi:uncharacterized membrane protein YphA (DoxX/SURF4 family)